MASAVSWWLATRVFYSSKLHIWLCPSVRNGFYLSALHLAAGALLQLCLTYLLLFQLAEFLTTENAGRHHCAGHVYGQRPGRHERWQSLLQYISTPLDVATLNFSQKE